MAKVIVKGTVIKQTISAVLTAVAQITEFSADSMENETADVTTIDTSGAGKEHLATGYTEGGNFSFGGFFDPALAGHKAITALLATPAPVVWNLVTTATGPVTHAFTSAGLGFGMTGAMNDCLKFNANLKLTGLMTFP
jgi:predicted secreted protein